MRHQSPNKNFATRLGDIVLSLLSIGGVISIILVILGFTMNISIMMFRTGSMDPTIPAGSIALVREIPATDMGEGDIITVDRGTGLLPVTHRVTEITDVDEPTGAVTFVMRGDANNYDDPDPYTATTVQRTFVSIPGIAPIIQQFQNPMVLGGLTLGATALVIWAFWPRKAHSQHSGTHDVEDDPIRLVEIGDTDAKKPRPVYVPSLSSVIVKQREARKSFDDSPTGADLD